MGSHRAPAACKRRSLDPLLLFCLCLGSTLFWSAGETARHGVKPSGREILERPSGIAFSKRSKVRGAWHSAVLRVSKVQHRRILGDAVLCWHLVAAFWRTKPQADLG